MALLSAEDLAVVKEIIEKLKEKIKEIDESVTQIVQSHRWSANEADEQAECVFYRMKLVKMETYLMMLNEKNMETEEYRIAHEALKKKICIYKFQKKHNISINITYSSS